MKSSLVLLLTTLLFVSASCLQSFTIGNSRLDVGEEIRISSNRDGKTGLKSRFQAPPHIVNEVFNKCSEDDDSKLCLQWGESVRLNIQKADEDCTTITWTLIEGEDITVCFDYENLQWFGGPERWLAAWPIQNFNIESEPYTIRQQNNQGVAEPYWLNSAGTSIYVSPNTALFTDSNNIQENGLCLIAKNAPPYIKSGNITLEYETCQLSNPVDAHKNAIERYLKKPTDIPDQLMMRYPIYSTWARYKTNINDQIVLDFMNEILDNKYPISHMEIDDKWEPCYGASVFDTDKFPSIKNLTDKLHSLGARATLWIYPYINDDCEPYFTQAKNEGKLVANQDGEVVNSWWNGPAGHVDFTNDTTAEWWVQRLRDLVEASGIDAFKFDGGESSWLPQLPILNSTEDSYPDIYTTKYVKTVSQFGSFIEVRVGKQTQEIPIFVRMLDKDSRWGLDNGLESLLVTLLQMNMNGYPFVLPDMVGGNVYGSDQVSKELFIRWLQANTFMPSVQFSIVPWDFDNETVEICRKFLNLRDQTFTWIVDAAKRSVLDGTPLNPPIWWIAPEDEIAHGIRDEYLLGTTLLVAPVIQDGARERDIYLPNGQWLDITREPNTEITGPQWLRNYTVALDELPIFQRL